LELGGMSKVWKMLNTPLLRSKWLTVLSSVQVPSFIARFEKFDLALMLNKKQSCHCSKLKSMLLVGMCNVSCKVLGLKSAWDYRTKKLKKLFAKHAKQVEPHNAILHKSHRLHCTTMLSTKKKLAQKWVEQCSLGAI